MNFDGISALVVIFLLFAIPIAFTTLIISTVVKKAHRHKKLSSSTVVTEYLPPEGLSPAEIGYLFDTKIGKKEFIATLLHLEQRGLIVFEHIQLGGIHVSRTHYFDNQPLKPHEQFVLDSLPEQRNLQLLSLKKLAGFKAAVAQSLQNQGLIQSKSDMTRYYIKRFLYTYLIINAFLLYAFTESTEGNPFLVALIVAIVLFAFFPFFAGLALLATFIYGKIVGYPGLIPKKLKRLWPSIEGFKDYVQKVELDRIQFESEQLKEKSKNTALPYAVALNMDTSWQDRFD